MRPGEQYRHAHAKVVKYIDLADKTMFSVCSDFANVPPVGAHVVLRLLDGSKLAGQVTEVTFDFEESIENGRGTHSVDPVVLVRLDSIEVHYP